MLQSLENNIYYVAEKLAAHEYFYAESEERRNAATRLTKRGYIIYV